MNRIYTALLTGFILAISLASCKKNQSNSASSSKIAPDGFTFNTSRKVDVKVQLLTNDDQPLKGVVVSIYTAAEANGNTAIMKAVSDANGYVTGTINVASYVDTLFVDPAYVGLMRYAKTYISGNALSATIGGSGGYGGNIVEYTQKARTTNNNQTSLYKTTGTTQYKYMGSYNLFNGKPNYLESTNDVITSTLLGRVNASLPEGISVAVSHPTYLSSSATTNVNVTALSDVWITFVSEGAGNLNCLGYYYYPTSTPPASPSDIDTIYHIFPNASALGSGGALISGNKVKLGRFQPGYSIGFVLFSNGWSLGAVNTSVTKFYSNDALNPESSSSLKRHTVLLNDATDNLFLVGFEDINRSMASCDNDFNDLVFYCSSNPVTAISTGSVQPLDVPTDSDGDGVSDVFDQFPNDPTRAYINYVPSQANWGTLAFEDLWPKTGDYDMNDLVVNYCYASISNAANNVVEMDCYYAVQAAGAIYSNGFGVQFPFAPSVVASITGQNLKNNYITSSANGTEAGQTLAVIIPFDDYHNVIRNQGNASFINTMTALPKVTGDTTKVVVNFTSPMTPSSLGTSPYNPFVIPQMHRTYEIHLAGNAPTDKFDKSLFGTGNDNSNVATGRYFQSASNWPWGINFVTGFSYPIETNSVSSAYPYFLQWAASGGTSYTDWYSNTGTEYRNTNLIYSK